MLRTEEKNGDSLLPSFSGTLGDGGTYDEDEEIDDNDDAITLRSGDNGAIPAWRPDLSSGVELFINPDEPPIPAMVETIFHPQHFQPVPNTNDLPLVLDPTRVIPGETELPIPMDPGPLDLWSCVPFPQPTNVTEPFYGTPWVAELPPTFEFPYSDTAIFQDSVGMISGDIHRTQIYQQDVNTSHWQ